VTGNPIYIFGPSVLSDACCLLARGLNLTVVSVTKAGIPGSYQ